MSKRKKRLLMVLGGVLVTVVVAAGAVLLAFRDSATPVTEEDVTGALVTVVGGGEPGDYGLYTYATDGFEQTDALTGALHEYPAETYLTIQPGGCGEIAAWQPLREHRTEWDFCADGSLAGWTSFTEWFGVRNTDPWVCTDPVAPGTKPGDVWRTRCTNTNPEHPAEQYAEYTVIGIETVSVDAQDVDTLHVRMTATSTGWIEGTLVSDTWTLPDTNLVVRRTWDYSTVQDTAVGKVHYDEQYEVLLTSLSPRS
jgi:hypothetical protein